jgi:hypothetical protein
VGPADGLKCGEKESCVVLDRNGLPVGANRSLDTIVTELPALRFSLNFYYL